jgi:IMP dehydrogenase
MKEYLTYDDVQLIPKYSDINHRSDCDVSTNLTKNIKLDIPIISSPMDTITEFDMAWAMQELGGIGIIHRFMSIQEQVQMASILRGYNMGAAIGVTGDYLERAKGLVNVRCKVLLLDIAHGHHKLVKQVIERLRNEINKKNICIVAGNIATGEAAQFLCDAGADAVRVGVGGGSLCSTRIQTGVGIPMVSSIRDVVSVCDNYGVSVIADGGIRTPGDVALEEFQSLAEFIKITNSGINEAKPYII